MHSNIVDIFYLADEPRSARRSQFCKEFNKARKEHIHHRCFEIFIANVVAARIAYNFQPKKPSVNIDVVDLDKVKMIA